MNSRSIRRLAADHSALHTQGLPPNYLFPPSSTSSDSLTELDVLLAGPTHTPFSAGLFKLHLSIPPTYPQTPPTAFFRTPLFHPNVNPQTGAVCVETLKRDWDAKLTLRDVLVTISCLLIQPNPDSALNEDAGGLIQRDYDAYAERARMLAGIHAIVPDGLREAVREAQNRGQDDVEGIEERKRPAVEPAAQPPQAPARRRRTIARVRGTIAVATRRSDGSPTGAPSRRAHAGPQTISEEQDRPFVFQSGRDDVFGGITTPPPAPQRRADTTIRSPSEDDNSTTMNDDDADQENDATRSPTKASTPPLPHARTPRRPHGAAGVPLGELTLDDTEPEPGVGGSDTEEDDVEMEAEYPPSPRKSSPRKQDAMTHRQQQRMGRTYGSPGANGGEPEASDQQYAFLRAPPPRMNPAGHASGSLRQIECEAEQDEEEEEDSAMLDVTFEETACNSRDILRRGMAGSGGVIGLGLFNTPPVRRPGGPAVTADIGEESGHRRPSTPPLSSFSDADTTFALDITAGNETCQGNARGKTRSKIGTPINAKPGLNGGASARALAKVVKLMNSTEKAEAEKQRRKELDERLWRACGGHVRRWNRGDFGEGVTFMKRGGRW